MKNIFLTLIVMPLILASISCEKTKKDATPIQIITDKETYSVNESIKLEIINSTDSIASYFVCSSYKGIPPNIYKFENNSWTGFWGPICNGFSSYCCAELQKGESYKDTLVVEFEKGTYRIEYQFIVRPSHEYKSYFSNSIRFE
jgi:hypothetical protein